MPNTYKRSFDSTRNGSSTIWAGRYKSCLVDNDQSLFTLYKDSEPWLLATSLVGRGYRFAKKVMTLYQSRI